MRIGTLLWLFLAALAGGALFAISYDVLALEEDLEDLNRAIVEEQTAIRVLQAEWSYLNNPSRLRTLTDEVADLQPVGPGQILAGLDALPYPLPVSLGDEVDDGPGDGDGAAEAGGRALASLPVPGRKPAAPPARRPTVTASAPTPAAPSAPPRPATAPVRTATPEPPAPPPVAPVRTATAEPPAPPPAAPRAGADAIDLLLAGIESRGSTTGQAEQ